MGASTYANIEGACGGIDKLQGLKFDKYITK
jgi:hypothetical protein